MDWTFKGFIQACGRILLTEEDRKEFLKKMRNPKAEVLQKNAITKKSRAGFGAMTRALCAGKQKE
ncbi:hypothetical protein ACLOJK_031362 [Asimina triloba]